MPDEEVLLTTTDNPYNPFTHYDEWESYDMMLARQQSRPTVPSYLTRIARLSSKLPDNMYHAAIKTAIDEIVELNLTGKYMKVTEKTAVKSSSSSSSSLLRR